MFFKLPIIYFSKITFFFLNVCFSLINYAAYLLRTGKYTILIWYSHDFRYLFFIINQNIKYTIKNNYRHRDFFIEFKNLILVKMTLTYILHKTISKTSHFTYISFVCTVFNSNVECSVTCMLTLYNKYTTYFYR